MKPKPEDQKKNDNKPDREVLREPGQISFKDAMKKAVSAKPIKKDK